MAKNYQVGLVIKGNAKGGVSAVKATKDELSQLNTKQKRFQKEAKSSSASIGGMTKEFGLLKGVVAGVSFGVLANEVYKGIDAFQGYRGQLKTITGDFDSASKELERLITLSKETPFTLAQSVEGFTKLTHLGLDPSRESMISYGNTAAAMGKDLMQMVEAVADASVGEFERLKEFGIKASSQGDKVRFTFQGTSTEIKKDAATIQQYLIDLGNNKFGDAMSDQMERLSAKTSNLQTSFAQLYDGFGSAGAAGGIGGSIDTIALGVDSLSANLPAVITVIETLSVVAGGHLVAALARSGKGFVDNKIAAMAKLQANVALQASELSLAKSANHKAIQDQLAAKRSLSIAQTTYARSRAINTLASANGKAAVSERLLTVATNAHNVAMKRASVTSRLLGGSMALLGGPVGVAMLAGYALYEMTSGMKAAKTAAEALKISTDKVASSIETMTKRQQELAADKYKNLIKSKSEELLILSKQAQQLEEMSLKDNSISARLVSDKKREAASVLSAELTILQDVYGKLQEELVGVNIENIKWNESTDDSASAIVTLSQESQSLLDRLDPLAKASRQFGADMKHLHQDYLKGALSLAEYKKHVSSLADEFKKSTTVKKVELSADQKFITSLKEKIRLGGLSESQRQAEINLSKLSINATEEQRQEVESYTAVLVEQQRIQDGINQENEYYQKAIDGVNGIGEAWASAGNVIVDTFGSIGQQLEKLFVGQEKYNRALEINAKKQKVSGADLVKLKKEESQLQRASASESLQGYASISGAAASMFSEQSKARKALHTAEKIFTIAEIALAMQRAYANAIAGVANQANGDPYTAFARMALMASAMAALGLAVSSSGSAPPSSEQRQQNQGTGTVLGSSDKSSSLNNSFERIEELELEQYAELRQMNDSLRDLNNNITQLAKSLVNSFGKFNGDSYTGELGEKSTTSSLEGFLIGGTAKIDPTGVMDKIISGFSSTKKSVVDSGISIVSQTMGDIFESGFVEAQSYFDIKTKKKKFWGAKKKTSYNTEYSDVDTQIESELALIFASIGGTVNSAVDVLGIDVTKNLDNFAIDLPNISFKDLSGDEIQAELEAVFSSQADLMSTYLVPALSDFQKVGEGLYETLVRIAQQQAIFNSVLNITGNSLASIDANAQIEVSQSIIAFAGSIEALRDAASTYLSEFFTEQEQFTFLTEQINQQFSSLGTTLPVTREAFKKVVSGLDLTTEADQRLYAQLMLLVPQMDEYYDALESQGNVLNDNADKIKAFNNDISLQLAALDFTPLESKLHNLQDEFTEYYNNAQGADLSLLEKLHGKKRELIIDDALTAINTAHENSANKLISENDKVSASFDKLSLSIAASILSIQKQAAGWNEGDYQNSKIADLSAKLGSGSTADQIANIELLKQAYVAKYNVDLDGLNQKREAAKSLYDEQLAQIDEQYQLELEIYNSMKDALLSLKDAADSLLLSDYSTLTNEQKFQEAQSQFETLFSSAQGGDVDALNKLSGAGDNYLKEAQQFYASGTDYSAIFDTVFNALNTLGNSSINAPGEPGTPALPSAISDYDNLLAELQRTTIESLTGLDSISQEVSLSVTTEFDKSMLVLNEKLEGNRLAVIDNTLAIQAIPLPNPQADNSDVVQALADVKAELIAQKEKTEERIKQAQAQADAAEEKADNLLKAFDKSTRVSERQLDEFQELLMSGSQ